MAESISLLFSNILLLGVTFIVCFFLFDFMKSRKNGSHFPPGPRGLPLLGNILQVDFRNPTVTYNQLRKQFGDIFSLQYFWSKTVVLNGFEVNKEALINRSEEVADRPPIPTYEKLGNGKDKKGILTAHYGSSWKEQRRFILTTLRNFGMGKKSLEERVTEEAKFLCSEFLSQKDQFDPTYFINNAVSNVICSIAFGDRFEYNDEKFLRLLHLFNETLTNESGLLFQIINDIPILIHIPWLFDRVMGTEYELIAFLKEIVSEHQKTWDPNYTRDYIDAYLVELEKGTNIITNLSSVLKDPQIWEKPLQFYPKHFLDENGKFVKREAFIPFSIGRRACVGEQLARMELFLFFTTFLQQLTFEIPNDQPRPREDPYFAITQSPHPYNIRVVARV
ncbi:cytochrome P450 2D14-like isoform X2 [Dendrobates tinctorius]|uniref:cytochrome P450 2D14-like isoform X2 n=1 Tax=Dendrobates tinctorius TaxID=92724 RepID=UPI003CC9EDDD